MMQLDLRPLVLLFCLAPFGGCVFGDDSVHTLAKRGDLNALRATLDRDPTLVNSRGKYGKTPLMSASLAGNTEIVAELLARGAKATDKEQFGLTARGMATIALTSFDPKWREGQVEHMRRQLVPEDEIKAWQATIEADCTEEQRRKVLATVTLLEQAEAKELAAGRSKLFDAVAAGDADVLRKRAKEESSVNVVDDEGKTPLIRAVLANRVDLVEILAAAGGDGLLRDKSGRGARDYAHGGSPKMRALSASKWDTNYLERMRGEILSGKMSLTAADENGQTALMRAVTDGDASAVAVLLHYAPDLDARDKARRSVDELVCVRSGDEDAKRKIIDMLAAARRERKR